MSELTLSDMVVIFDLDGTLIDSAPDLTTALNHVLGLEGLAAVEPATVRPMVGHGARALLIRGYELHGKRFPEGDEGEALVSGFIDYYAENSTVHTTLFPGAEACLDRLEENGAALAVCTNKLERLSLPILEGLGVRNRFAEIVCRDSLPEYKPSPLPLLEILRRTGREKGAMIGDTMTDINAARAAGLPAYWANFGYGVVEEGLRKNEQRFETFEALSREILEQMG